MNGKTDSGMPQKPALTEKESAVLAAIVRLNDDFNNGDARGSVWTADVAGESGLSPAQIGGVYASLIEKGLIWSTGDEEPEPRTGLTEAGIREAVRS